MKASVSQVPFRSTLMQDPSLIISRLIQRYHIDIVHLYLTSDKVRTQGPTVHTTVHMVLLYTPLYIWSYCTHHCTHGPTVHTWSYCTHPCTYGPTVHTTVHMALLYTPLYIWSYCTHMALLYIPLYIWSYCTHHCSRTMCTVVCTVVYMNCIGVCLKYAAPHFTLVF